MAQNRKPSAMLYLSKPLGINPMESLLNEMRSLPTG